jgi:molybdopterin/thiamine biosynthesis adenylyltransferase
VREPWYERWPELLDWELERFSARRLPAEIDVTARAEGRLVIRSCVSYQGAAVPIDAHYPAETPELPPVIVGPPGLLNRHEHAFGGNFCLLERPIDDWPGGSWGAADLIGEQLERLLRDSEAGPAAVRAAEAPMPEPYTAYYNYPYRSVVLMPEHLVSPERDEGVLNLRPFAGENFRFIVESVAGASGDPALLTTIGLGDRLSARWKRVNAPPPGPDGADVLRWIRHEHPELVRQYVPLPRKLANTSRIQPPPALQVAAVVFEEEGPGVGHIHDAWLFLVVPTGQDPFLAHCQVTSPAERRRRTPELAGIEEKRALVVGLGTLGGDVALELAKAGIGQLDLVDFDRYETNNSVRHVLGIESAGFDKTEAVAQACRRINPFCKTDPVNLQLGAVDWQGESTLDQFVDRLESADLVIDTTGSHQLQRLVGRLAGDAGVPFVSCWLTTGFYGAHVLRIVPGRTSCFLCAATRMAEGELLEAEAGPDAQVVAQGCSHPTVPGAGFDAAETAAITTRVSVQTLRDGQAYGDLDWDHVAVSFRRSPSDSQYPRFAVEELEPSEGCRQCSSAVGRSAPR